MTLARGQSISFPEISFFPHTRTSCPAPNVTVLEASYNGTNWWIVMKQVVTPDGRTMLYKE